MRKRIIFFTILLFAVNNALGDNAMDDCDKYTGNENLCKKDTSCVYATTICRSCVPGKKPNKNQNECEECKNKPKEYDNTQYIGAGTAGTGCPWGWTPYTIVLNDGQLGTRQVEVKCPNLLYAEEPAPGVFKEGEKFSDTISTPDTKWWQEFLGYYQTKDAPASTAPDPQRITANGEFVIDDPSTNQDAYISKCGFNAETSTLYARWKNIEKFNIEYYIAGQQVDCLNNTQGVACDNTAQTCVPGQSCKLFTISRSGYTVNGWRCLASDTNGCVENTTFEPGEEIKDHLELFKGPKITLHLDYTKCETGYYCENGVKTKCPAPSTSEPGAKSIKDCYIKGGQKGTKFCDSVGCFYLPDGLKIYHK